MIFHMIFSSNKMARQKINFDKFYEISIEQSLLDSNTINFSQEK